VRAADDQVLLRGFAQLEEHLAKIVARAVSLSVWPEERGKGVARAFTMYRQIRKQSRGLPLQRVVPRLEHDLWRSEEPNCRWRV
jgi:hypothetical protein